MATIGQALDRIANSCGHLVLNADGSVLQSGGELANDEKSARVAFSMVVDGHKLAKQASRSKNFNRISVIYSGFSLLITVSNQKIYVVKVRSIS